MGQGQSDNFNHRATKWTTSYNADAQRLARQQRLQQLHGNLAASYTGDTFSSFTEWPISSVEAQVLAKRRRLAYLQKQQAIEAGEEPFRRTNENFSTFTKWVGSSMQAQQRNKQRRLRQLIGEEPFSSYTKWPTPNLALQEQQPLWKVIGEATNIDNPYEVWTLEQMKGTLTYRVTSPNGSVQYNLLQDRPLRNGNLIYPKNNVSLKLRVILPHIWY